MHDYVYTVSWRTSENFLVNLFWSCFIFSTSILKAHTGFTGCHSHLSHCAMFRRKAEHFSMFFNTPLKFEQRLKPSLSKMIVFRTNFPRILLIYNYEQRLNKLLQLLGILWHILDEQWPLEFILYTKPTLEFLLNAVAVLFTLVWLENCT